MIDALNHELITWLGYLQRGSVLLQLAILLITVMLEKRSRLTRRLNSELMRSVSHLIAPGALIVLGAAMKGLQWPGGYLQYLALLWMIWRLVEPTKLLLQKRFPRLPVEALDRSLFRPVLLVFSVLSFFQILGSRESLSIIELGGCVRRDPHPGQIAERSGHHLRDRRLRRPTCGPGGLVGRHLSRPETPGATGP